MSLCSPNCSRSQSPSRVTGLQRYSAIPSLTALFKFTPPEILRIIQLDLDLKYKTNIRELFEEFDNFPPGAVIGIAREMQPVYR